MVLELHVWGPAFGLPSFDAPCLAAIAYLKQSLPEERWTLVASSDPDISPFGQLPVLRDESHWVAGFRNIVEYLNDTQDEAGDLDAHLNEAQLADREAYLAFIESRGQPLLDLSIYVSSDNYTNCTRSALAEILEWPQSWTVPQQLRVQAQKRSEHLGLSALDVDAVREKELKRENEGIKAQIPKSLRIGRKTVSSLLGSNAQQTRFRLEATSAEFFEPLEDFLGQQKYFFGHDMTLVDCMALGYLSLMKAQNLPQPWLQEQLSMKHKALDRWANENASLVFGPPVTAKAAIDGTATGSSPLPWSVPESKSWLRLGQTVLNSAVASLPVLGTFKRRVKKTSELQQRQEGRVTRYRQKELVYRRLQDQRDLYYQLCAVGISTAALLVYSIYTGRLYLPKPQPRRAARSFGQAGSILGLR